MNRTDQPHRRAPILLAALFVLGAHYGCGAGGQRFATAPPVGIPHATRTHDDLRLPNEVGSFKFAVIGDSGTGKSAQFEVGRAMADVHKSFPFTHVFMAGDNMYGPEEPSDYQRKFEEPYQELLNRGVEFRAALGNHDEPNQRHYELFNMGGESYYSFKPVDPVRVYILDSSYLDPDQVEWLEKELEASDSPWKFAVFHHPLYSSAGRHGSDLLLRQTLEPLFVRHGVDLVFAGHDHVYERTKPQDEITHFVIGASAKLRRGDLQRSFLTAAGYDDGYSYLVAEIIGDEFHFQAFNEDNETIDRGVLRERSASPRSITTDE